MAKAKRSAGRAEVSAAITNGRADARAALAFRAAQGKRRAKAVKEFESRPRRRRALEAAPAVPRRARALLGSSTSAGVLIAEGDSWFDYPFHDVLQILEDDYLYDVESVAHKGDCIEDMAHSGGQFADFARRLEKLLRANKVPKAILLSGGGNDIAGDEFAILLNHATSSLPALNEDILRGVIDVRLKNAYARIIGGLTAIAQSYLGKPIPIVTHGYDFALPDGRGFLGGAWILPGPWLEPGFRKKGYQDFVKNAAVVKQLINRFNVMLESVSVTPGFAHVKYLNLRGHLRTDPTTKEYKKDWANELHPSKDGFKTVTAEFARLIAKL